MRLSGFRDHVKYDENSFKEAINISFDAVDVDNRLLYFDIKSP